MISRLPRCSGQVSDAVSAFTQFEMKDTPDFLHLSREDCPKIWIRLPTARRPQHRDSIDDPVVPLERNLHGHGLLCERKVEKLLLEEEWKRVPRLECLHLHCKRNYARQCMLRTSRWQEILETCRRCGLLKNRFGRPSITH